MEAQYRNAEVMVHMESDTPEIRLEGHVNVGSGKSNWVTLTIAGLTISFFTPTPMGVLHIFDEFKKGTLMKNYSEEETTQEQESPSLESIQVEITSYNADPAQTDSTPLITASGVTVAEDTMCLVEGHRAGIWTEVRGYYTHRGIWRVLFPRQDE